MSRNLISRHQTEHLKWGEPCAHWPLQLGFLNGQGTTLGKGSWCRRFAESLGIAVGKAGGSEGREHWAGSRRGSAATNSVRLQSCPLPPQASVPIFQQCSGQNFPSSFPETFSMISGITGRYLHRLPFRIAMHCRTFIPRLPPPP